MAAAMVLNRRQSETMLGEMCTLANDLYAAFEPAAQFNHDINRLCLVLIELRKALETIDPVSLPLNKVHVIQDNEQFMGRLRRNAEENLTILLRVKFEADRCGIAQETSKDVRETPRLINRATTAFRQAGGERFLTNLNLIISILRIQKPLLSVAQISARKIEQGALELDEFQWICKELDDRCAESLGLAEKSRESSSRRGSLWEHEWQNSEHFGLSTEDRAGVSVQSDAEKTKDQVSQLHGSDLEVYDEKLGLLVRLLGEIEAAYRVKAKLDSMQTAVPPFRELIKSGDIERVAQALQEDFESIANGEFHWLRDLVGAGYHNPEIAELLVDVEADSPWLYYAPTVWPDKPVIYSGHHQKLCIHSAMSSQSTEESQQADELWLPEPDYIDPEQRNEIKRQIVEQCGLGGVVPSSRTVAGWDGQVFFRHVDGHTTAFVSYESAPSRGHKRVLVNLQNTARRIRTAFALLQRHRACCSSFTFLRKNMHDSEGRLLDLCNVDVDHLLRLLEIENQADIGDTPQFKQINRAADEIITMIMAHDKDRDGGSNVAGDGSFDGSRMTRWERLRNHHPLHWISLALQIVALGLLSYSRAHAGALHPFFLTHAVHKVVLLGTDRPPEHSRDVRIVAELAQLTCMNGLTRDAVLSFHSSNEVFRARGQYYDMMASPVDLVDTWGPGILIRETEESEQILGIEIGGGILSLVSGKGTDMLHWQPLQPHPDATQSLGSKQLGAFSLLERIRIGATQANQNCPLQTADRLDEVRKSCEEYLFELGTSRTGWYPKARHLELQLGQYAVANFGLEFEKREGITVKERILQRLESSMPRIFLGDLEAHYGLEVSICTGVARRIPLRLLLANALPAYIDSSIPGPPAAWEQFGTQLIDALKGPDLSTWFQKSPTEHRLSATNVLGSLLIHLRSTGLDSEENLNIAWLCPQRVQLCFKLRCDDVNLWAKILEDTDHCATFACITTTCLETDQLRCQGANTSPWRNVSEILTTEICRYTDTPSSKITQPRQPFVLRENNKYWIGPANAGLLASVSRTGSTTLEISRDWLRRIPKKHQQRILMLQRAQRERLRERGATSGQTVMVAVCSHRN